ncbi:MAG: TIM barrel protein [Balneolaceae bacterium]|nr:TIM barrel protein [Balneolaceae bacterium]
MKIANAPCSWGVLEFGLEGKTADYQTVLREMSDTGYMGTELGDWGFMPTDPAILKDILSKYNLDLIGAFVPVNFINAVAHESGAKTAIKIASLLSAINPEEAKIVLSDENGKNSTRRKMAGRIEPRHSLNISNWSTFAEGVNFVAKRVFEETGVESVFHHHCAGYVETPNEIDKLLDRTNSDLVGLCFDTGHYAFGGGDPIQGLKKYSERIKHVHFKDWSQSIAAESAKNEWDYFESVKNGIFCELGKGSIDFEKILEELKSQEYDGWIVVEQDILPGMGSPKESAQRNREFLRSIGI